MLTFLKLSKNPGAFQRMTGASVRQFKTIANIILPYWEELERKRLTRANRQRAIGAGAKYRLPTLQDKLLVIFLYYRSYITMEFLGYLFDLNRSNICRLIQRLQIAMNEASVLPGDRPIRDRSRRRKISDLNEFLEEYPEIEDLIIDATEQQVERPKRQQKSYFSGKKKCHTMKTQIVINKEGEIINTSESVPGKNHDRKVSKKSAILNSIPSDMKIMGDSGYQGIKDDFPNATIPHKKKRGGPKLTKEQKHENRKISRKRVLVENVIGKLKIFKILSYKYRGKRKKHGEIVRIIAYIYNIKYNFAF